MLVQVLFTERNAINGQIEGWDHVADVNAPDHYDTDKAMEYAFRRLQNIEGSWSMGHMIETPRGDTIPNFDFDDNVTVLKPLERDARGHVWGHRSCSVFDRMIVDGVIYEVDCFGFKKVAD